MFEQTGGQPSAFESRVTSLLETIEIKLHTLENRGLQSSTGRPDKGTSQRLQALEAKMERTSEMLQSFATTNDRLAQLTLRDQSRALKEARSAPVASPTGSPPASSGGLEEGLQAINTRLSVLEDCMLEVGARAADNSSAAQLAQISQSLQLLEQRFSCFQDEMQERLSVLEERIPEAGAPVADNSSAAQLAQISQSLQLLEQRFISFQDEMQESHAATEAFKQSFQTKLSQAFDMPQSDSMDTIAEDEARAASSNHLDYEWKHNIWDLALFVGTKIMSPGASLVVAICVGMNLFMLIAFIEQTLFLGIPEFDKKSAEEFLLWRKTVAHAVEYRNRITGESLANGVCTEKLYFPVANYQLNTVIALRSYLQPMPFLGFDTQVKKGMMMCLLSLWVWYLTVTVELREVLDLLLAFRHVPIESKTRFVQDKDEKEKVHLVSVSTLRWIFVMFIQLVRIAAAGILAYRGTLYLLAEFSVEDMILNSAALAIILNFDEMLFEAVMPSIPQRVISQVMPLPRGKLDRMAEAFHSYGWAHFVFVSFSIVFACLITFSLLPLVEILTDNRDALCGGVDGTYDFVVGVDSIGIPWAASTPSSNFIADLYAHKAIADALEMGFEVQKLQPPQRSNTGPFMQVLSGDILETLMKAGVQFQDPQDWSVVDPRELQDVVGWPFEWMVLGSKDLGDEPGTVYNRYLQHLLGTSGSVTCEQAPAYMCNKQGSRSEDVVMRVLCSNRCGCAKPTEGTVSNPDSDTAQYGYMGCAAWNIQKKTFVEILGSLPCEDTKSRDVFVTWVEGIGHGVNSTGGKLLEYLVSKFDEGQCPAVTSVFLGTGEMSRICASTSLPSICPQACGCDESLEWNPAHASEVLYCPYSCNRSKPPCITIHIPPTWDPGSRGPYVGFPCQFPFLYKGKEYNKCTADDWTGPWCGVALQDGVSQEWGDCPNNSDVCVGHWDKPIGVPRVSR